MQDKIITNRPSKKAFSNIGGFMDKAKKILELYQQIEKHIRFLEGNMISEEESND